MTHESKQKTEQVAPPRQQEFAYSPDELSQVASETRSMVDDLMLNNAGVVIATHMSNPNMQEGAKKKLNVLTIQRTDELQDGSSLTIQVESIESPNDLGESSCEIQLTAWGTQENPGIKSVHIYTLNEGDVLRRYDISEDEWNTQNQADGHPLPSQDRMDFEQSVGLNNLPVGLDELNGLKKLLVD